MARLNRMPGTQAGPLRPILSALLLALAVFCSFDPALAEQSDKPTSAQSPQTPDSGRTLDTLTRFFADRPPPDSWMQRVAYVPVQTHGLEIQMADGTRQTGTWNRREIPSALVLLGPDCPVCIANVDTVGRYMTAHPGALSPVVVALPDADAATVAMLVSRGYRVAWADARFVDFLVLVGAGERGPAVILANGRLEVVEVTRGRVSADDLRSGLSINDHFLWEQSGTSDFSDLLGAVSMGQLPRSISEAPTRIHFDDWRMADALREVGERSIREQREYGHYFTLTRTIHFTPEVGLSDLMAGTSSSINIHDGMLEILRTQQAVDQFKSPVAIYHSHPGRLSFSPRDLFLAAYGRRPGLITYGERAEFIEPRLAFALPTLRSGAIEPWATTEALTYQYFAGQQECARQAQGLTSYNLEELNRRLAVSLNLAMYDQPADAEWMDRIDTTGVVPFDWSLPGFRPSAVELMQVLAADGSSAGLRQGLSTPSDLAELNAVLRDAQITAEDYIKAMTLAAQTGRIDGSYLHMFFDPSPTAGEEPTGGVEIRHRRENGRCGQDAVVRFFDFVDREPRWTEAYIVSWKDGNVTVTPSAL